MKKVALITICAIFLLSCENENELTVEKYNLVKVSGGFAGVNEVFEPGEIIWTLNEQEGTLIIEKNINEPFTGINEGSYSYFIETIDSSLYFNIDNNETGGLTLLQKAMVIDENISSTGGRADGFIYEFEK